MKRRNLSAIALAAALAASPTFAETVEPAGEQCSIVVAQAGTRDRELQPRYEPAYDSHPRERSTYNDRYIFGMTRGIADSTIHPAAKAPLFALVLPLDLVFLPFAVIGGFFG